MHVKRCVNSGEWRTFAGFRCFLEIARSGSAKSLVTSDNFRCYSFAASLAHVRFALLSVYSTHTRAAKRLMVFHFLTNDDGFLYLWRSCDNQTGAGMHRIYLCFIALFVPSESSISHFI